jgi:hypothetical protein
MIAEEVTKISLKTCATVSGQCDRWLIMFPLIHREILLNTLFTRQIPYDDYTSASSRAFRIHASRLELFNGWTRSHTMHLNNFGMTQYTEEIPVITNTAQSGLSLIQF